MDAKVIIILIIIGLGVVWYYYPQQTYNIADSGWQKLNPNKTAQYNYTADTSIDIATNDTIITITAQPIISEPVNVTETIQNVTVNVTDSNIVGKPYGFNCISEYDCRVSFMTCFNSNCICNKDTGNCELV